MRPITPFLNELVSWKSIVQNKSLLFDTDAVISILEYRADGLCDAFEKIEVIFCLIHPVYVELLKTDSAVKRIDRQTFLNKYNFHVLPLTSRDMDRAKDIQAYLLLSKSYTASPTDLYLGGILSRLSRAHIHLVTSNLTDFPYPLYTREAGIVLQSNRNSKILHLLSIDNTELAKTSFKQ